ncbi:AraC family transcriptional regulator [Spongiactinospora sp. TRM90649]|uniref:AraC family transcriptional regulator n=1 Tax=Spongiactinospora sp. TRM90649 TaxID=3031114 RepID=UPI0023F8564E|nr:AraC family transcriptional regulator [Spongiactinospora sp. TRM90649]MDF5754550.1 AraC family transcriptional regulator [Spongiactinospora sp. TRM90649]
MKPALGDARGRRLRFGGGGGGIERMEAVLVGEAFSPHRHDTYAIGMTMAGVQTFRYRGEGRVCLPGEWHVLHPDEVHDGAAGTDEGFGYRILYVDPALVQRALGGRPLPFVADPVVRPEGIGPSLAASLRRMDEPLAELERVELAVLVADALVRHADTPPGRAPSPALAVGALSRVREMIAADPATVHPVSAFERVSGLSRWTIARQFRAAFGTSPTRYRTMRRLDLVRRTLRDGTPLRDAALAAGFADQSHMTRMFRRAYGLTPGEWTAALT